MHIVGAMTCLPDLVDTDGLKALLVVTLGVALVSAAIALEELDGVFMIGETIGRSSRGYSSS